MKVSYTGSHEKWTPIQQKKIDARFAKLSKLFDRRGEKEAHVILTSERHLHNAEITVNYYDHRLVGLTADPDQFTALTGAIDKLETQILKARTKWRDTKRTKAPDKEPKETAAAPEPDHEAESAGKRVYRVNHKNGNKPMTLEEAMMAIDDQDYLVFRDAETDRLNVLLRRRDGHFDLIEA